MYTQLNKKNSWTNNEDYVLKKGEPGYDIKNKILKIGNGKDAWKNLRPATSLSLTEGYEGTINGLVEAYKVNAGASVNAGDFVEFVRVFASGSFTPGGATQVSAAQLNDNKVVVAYVAEGKGWAKVLDFSEPEVKTGDARGFDIDSPYLKTSSPNGCLVSTLNGEQALFFYYYNTGTDITTLYRHSDIYVIPLTINGYAITASNQVEISKRESYSYSGRGTVSNLDFISTSDGSGLLTYTYVYVPSSSSGSQTTYKHYARSVYMASSGTINIGNETTLSTASTSLSAHTALLPQNKILLIYPHNLRIAMISGSQITYGPTVELESHNVYPIALQQDLGLIVYYTAQGGKAQLVFVDGINITLGEAIDIAGKPNYVSGLLMDSNKILLTYRDDADFGLGKATILQLNNGLFQDRQTTIGVSALNYTKLNPLSNNQAQLFYNDGLGKYTTLLVEQNNNIIIQEQAGTYVQPAYSLIPNVGVAQTDGIAGEYVNVVRVRAKYDISAATTNLIATPTSARIFEDESTTIQITPNTGYLLPENITAPADADYTWSKDTGVLTVNNPKSDLKFIAAGVQIILETPMIELDGSVVSWDAIENALSYKVYKNGSLLTTTSELYVNLAELITAPGEHIIKILAVGAPYGNSAYSNEVTYVIPLSAPVLELNEDTLNIYTVPVATNYDLYSNDELLTTLDETSGTVLGNSTALADIYENESSGYGFSVSGTTLVPTNKGQVNSYAYTTLRFVTGGTGKVTLNYTQSSESGYDYGVVSNIDTYLSKDTEVTTNAYGNAKGVSGNDSFVYNNVPAGEHFITVKYRKDGSNNSGSDTFTITSLVLEHPAEIWAIDLTKFLTEGGTYLLSAIAKAEGYVDSVMSNAVEYLVELKVETEPNEAGGTTYTIESTDYTTKTNESGGTTYVIGQDVTDEGDANTHGGGSH